GAAAGFFFRKRMAVALALDPSNDCFSGQCLSHLDPGARDPAVALLEQSRTFGAGADPAGRPISARLSGCAAAGAAVAAAIASARRRRALDCFGCSYGATHAGAGDELADQRVRKSAKKGPKRGLICLLQFHGYTQSSSSGW